MSRPGSVILKHILASCRSYGMMRSILTCLPSVTTQCCPYFVSAANRVRRNLHICKVAVANFINLPELHAGPAALPRKNTDSPPISAPSISLSVEAPAAPMPSRIHPGSFARIRSVPYRRSASTIAA